MKHLVLLFLLTIGLMSCHYPLPEGEDVRAVVHKNTNLELYADSVELELLPIKDTYIQLYKGAQVVVAELAVHPEDSVDTVWVKVAHSQEVQGWLRESELTAAFVPVDSISQFIYLFSYTHVSYFIGIVALFLGVYIFRISRRKQIHIVYVKDIDSLYPLLLCLLLSISATLYQSIQLFAPETWQQYFFSPTLSPFKVPFVLSAFLITFWLILLVSLAVLDDVFSRLSSSEAFFYLLGLLSTCIFCYFFFSLTTYYYVGYLFLAIACVMFFRKARKLSVYKYYCGSCGRKLKVKGACPHCGTVNS